MSELTREQIREIADELDTNLSYLVDKCWLEVEELDEFANHIYKLGQQSREDDDVVERVADALIYADGWTGYVRTMNEPQRDVYRAKAKAAIAALGGVDENV